MHLSGFTRAALALAGLTALAVGTGCAAPSDPPSDPPLHPADQLIGPSDIPASFLKATDPGAFKLPCPALEQALAVTGEQSLTTFRSGLTEITERITLAGGPGQAEAGLKAATGAVGGCPSSTPTRPPGGIAWGKRIKVTPLDRPAGLGDDAMAARAVDGTDLEAFVTDLLVIRQGPELVELRITDWNLKPGPDIDTADLARKAVHRLRPQ
ncbi:hypothetical protein [Kitasatospora sp. NPDC101183]|uniref:hypothetical protein n=1 Tax=Kitasatospora sp. NPDC101183 TaxID=3364100 RepID=UPI00381C5484